MAQTGTIFSYAPASVVNRSYAASWVLEFTYALDAGGFAQATIVVGADSNGDVAGYPANIATPITVPLANTPGTTNQVQLFIPAKTPLSYGIFGGLN